MKKIFHARMETPSFLFEAYGATQLQAAAGLRKARTLHAKQYGLDKTWSDTFDFSVREVILGEPYRDHELIQVSA